MKRLVRIRRALAVLSIVSFVAASSAGCASVADSIDPDRLSVPAEQNRPIRLTVWLYERTGLEPFLERYAREHPDVRIEWFVSQFEDVHNHLQTAFAAGSGAPDVCLIEVSFIERFKRFPDYFYNLADFGAASLRDNYLDWKWRQATSVDGGFVFGLPTDIGPMAMLYRPERFERAGLPADRESVARIMRTWDDFLRVGEQIRKQTGKPVISNIHELYQAILGQSQRQYFDPATGELIMASNPEVRRAWDYAVRAYRLGLSAGLQTWQPEWAEALADGGFAVLLSPSWMLNYVKTNAPEAEGDWDVAAMPGGGGNRGGSFLTIPKESGHPKEAYDLVRWLTSPEIQLELYRRENNFPSARVVFDDPIVRDKRDPFFRNAPVGRLFADSARRLKPAYEGPYQFVVVTAVESVLYKVERGELAPEQAWNEAVSLVRKQLSAVGARAFIREEGRNDPP